jgi:hypothetical protein
LKPRRQTVLKTLPILLSLNLAQPAVPPTRQVPAASPSATAGIRFADVTRESGVIAFTHVSGSPAKNYIIETTGSGVALLDFDRDGWLDIYLVNGGTLEPHPGGVPAAALFRNNGDRTFRDVTAAAGIGNERWGQGVCVGDVDNDGAPVSTSPTSVPTGCSGTWATGDSRMSR